MSILLVRSGPFALVTAATHAFGGERSVGPNPGSSPLPSTPFGDGSETRTIVYVAW